MNTLVFIVLNFQTNLWISLHLSLITHDALKIVNLSMMTYKFLVILGGALLSSGNQGVTNKWNWWSMVSDDNQLILIIDKQSIVQVRW